VNFLHRRIYKVINATFLVGSITIFFLSLIWNNLVHGWEHQTNPFYFWIVSIVFILLLAIGVFLYPENFRLANADMLFIVFVIYVSINSIIRSGLDSLNDSTINFLCVLFTFFIFKRALKYFSWQNFERTIIILALITSLYSLLQFFGYLEPSSSGFKVTAFFANPGPLASFLAVTLPFSIFSCLKGSKKMKLVMTIIVTITFAAIIITASRAALIAVIFICVLSLNHFFQVFNRYKRANHKPLIAIAVCLIVFLLFVFLVYWKSDSSLGRILIWRVTFDLVSKNWLAGVGLGLFEVQYPNYQAEYFSTHVVPHFSYVAGMNFYAFNEFLQVLAESGLIGLSLFLLIIYYSFFKIKVKTDSAACVKICLASILIIGLFFYSTKILPIQIIFIFCLACLASQDQKYVNVNFPSLVRAIALTFLISNVFLLQKLIIRYPAIREWETSYALSFFDKRQAILSYQKIMPILNYNGEFLFNYGALQSESKQLEESIKTLRNAQTKFNHIDLHLYLGNCYKGLNRIDEAVQCYTYASHMIPSRFYPKYLLALLYKDNCDIEAAQRKAKEIIDMKVKVPSTTIIAIKSEMKKMLEDL
jgi:tetratricopeptide (TPR) repeat protein